MGQRPVDQHSDVVGLGVGKHRFLDGPVEEVVGRLERLDRQGGAEGLHLLGGEVRHADVAHLAVGDERGQGAGGLLEGSRRVGPMDLVEIDGFGSQRPQALLDPVPDPFRAGVSGHPAARGGAKAALGGDHQPVATPVEGLGQQLFGLPETVPLSGVEQGHAPLRRQPNGGHRLGLVGGTPVATQLPGAERNLRHDQPAATQSRLFHGALPESCYGTLT